MTEIAGDVPQPVRGRGWTPRVVVKMKREARIPFSRSAQFSMPDGAGETVRRTVQRIHPRGRLVPYLSETDGISAGRRDRLSHYFSVTAPDADRAVALAREISALDDVETAYVEGGPTPPPTVNATDDPLSATQGYLDAAPHGIDARFAWGHTDGHGVGFVDVEQGWTLNHEDLAAAGIHLISGVNTAYFGHGTAVLGEVVAVDNTLGGVGIAPAAHARVVSQYRADGSYGTAAAILSAVDVMSAGDVMLLEAQTFDSAGAYLPVEIEAAVFDAIRAATDAGIVVIEAGGNGSVDLDAWTDDSGNHLLRRSDPAFQDSGAIMVGAASADVPHTRLYFSNFGSRIDCFGWGADIVTTGDGWTGTSTSAYTDSFGGTSGASPIIAGAALLLQAFSRQHRGRVLDPSTMRSLVSGAVNTHSGDPAADRIGVLPNLRALIQTLVDDDRFLPHIDVYVEGLYILFGLINDAPGMIWVPGVGPVPVNPGWESISKELQLQFIATVAGELEREGLTGISAEQLGHVSIAALRKTLEVGSRR
ncbi:hypothetical protein ABIB25_004208 [Nakamurella sp. UYEF19]|uniref:S8 family peptidase n=1 Tax=Nakamurella sp. UYEF19 TaxID=1756392 RepID=UPI0033959870